MNRPSAMLGSINASSPVPSTGTQPSCVAKTWMRIMPIQKLGSDSPTSARVMQAVSIQPLGETPATTPSVLPISRPMMKPPTASCRV